MATHDLPAVVEFIQNTKKNKDKVSLIGYSQGTTIVAASLALHPTFWKQNSNIAVLIGPAILFKYSKEPTFVSLSKNLWFGQLLIMENYLEFDGKNAN